MLMSQGLRVERKFQAVLQASSTAVYSCGRSHVLQRGADTSRLELTPQSAGLYALSLGLSHDFTDDHEMLKHGMVMYDALYAWCKDGQDETHTWNPAAYR